MSTWKEIVNNIKTSFSKSIQGLKLGVSHKAKSSSKAFKDSVEGLKEAASSVKSSTSKVVPSLKKGIGTSLHRQDDNFPMADPSEDLAAKSHRESSSENFRVNQEDKDVIPDNGFELESYISEGIRIELSPQEQLSSSVETKKPFS